MRESTSCNYIKGFCRQFQLEALGTFECDIPQMYGTFGIIPIVPELPLLLLLFIAAVPTLNPPAGGLITSFK